MNPVPDSAAPRPGLPAAGDVHCPRCGGGFRCGASDPGPCACTTLKLDAPLRVQLQQRWQGCLCLSCLAALAAGAALDPPRSA